MIVNELFTYIERLYIYICTIEVTLYPYNNESDVIITNVIILVG